MCLWLIAPAVVRAERLPATVCTARDGIAPTVRRIVADSKGFIWFAGTEGLVRFDGNEFRVFTEADGLPVSSTSALLERPDGTYWVAAEEQLCAFDPRPNRQRFRCERPKLGDINTLLQDETTLWCGTETGLWRRPANGDNPWEFVRGIEPGAGRRPAVYRLLKDTRGDVWATTVSASTERRETDSRAQTVATGSRTSGAGPPHLAGRPGSSRPPVVAAPASS